MPDPQRYAILFGMPITDSVGMAKFSERSNSLLKTIHLANKQPKSPPTRADLCQVIPKAREVRPLIDLASTSESPVGKAA
jgi:hypothetical protein